MLKSLRYPALLAVLSGTLFLANLGGAHLWDVDEAIFSQAAREMLDRGDYVVPYFNGEVFPDKPPVMYWGMITAYKLFGPTEFAARVSSALFGVGSVLLTYRLGCLMFSPAVGLASGTVLATTLNFNVINRAATPDSFLVFFVTLSLYLFVSGTAKSRALSGRPGERNAPWAGQTRFEPSWFCYACAYAAMGCAVLTKGPVGVVLPTAIIGLFLLSVRARPIEPSQQAGWRGMLENLLRRAATIAAPGHFFRTAWSMRPLTAVVAVLAVAAPWYVWVGLETDGQWLVGFFGVHNFGRFLHAMENHRGPIVYYLPAITIGFFPWSMLFAPLVVQSKRYVAQHHPWRAGFIFLASWVAVWVGFFSMAGTKLPSYVVPAYPAIALAVGALAVDWLRQGELVSRVWMRTAWCIVGLVGVGMLIALPIVAHVFLGDDWLLGAIGLLPLIAAITGWTLTNRFGARGAVFTLAGLGTALSLALFAAGAAYVDRYQDSPALAQAIARATDGDPPAPAIASFRFFRPSFVFYTGSNVHKLESPEAVNEFFAQHPGNAFLLTDNKQFALLRSSLPADVVALATHRRFLRSGQVMVLGRTNTSSTARSINQAPAAAR